jgi:mRNA interferase MazF
VVKEIGYVPKRGDVVWVDFSPTQGHEQSGRRPALVLSTRRYNHLTSLMLACPITRSSKGYMFEVAIPSGLEFGGVVLADHVRSMDWRQRNATFLGRMPEDVVHTVRQAVHVLVEGPLE